MREVTWTILNVDQDNRINVHFTDGVNENIVWYKWTGDIENVREQIVAQALNYRDWTWKEASITEEDKTAILALSDSTATINVVTDNTTANTVATNTNDTLEQVII